ncbi:MAG TPA: NADH-quinone oxidoreductase subunit N [Chitinophagales bacterium]|nr:NADH-quinone oxidoreductase subunit N [Chitinophagales bacterium]
MNVLISLTALGMLAMFGGVFNLRKILMPLTVLGLMAVMVLNYYAWNLNAHLFNDMMAYDNFAVAFSSVCLIGALFTLLFYYMIYGAQDEYFPEVFSIIIFSLIGAVVMVSFNNVLMLFLGLEILSLSLYVLAGIRKKDLLSNEAAMKYFLMGAFSTGFLLFGIAMLYGASGSFYLTAIGEHIKLQAAHPDVFIITGIIMMLIGLLFKVAVFPFQFWTPDVYQGSPTIITGYMATVGKVAAFAAFLRLLENTFISAQASYQDLLWIIAVVTMLAGNIIAIYQRSVKRMLAYSSIAHAGYMLIALMTGNNFSNSAVLFYAAAYTFASLGAFIIVLMVQESTGDDQQTSFSGLAKSQPWLAFVLAVSMLSLSGIPPTAGFFAKFYIFSSAVSSGWIWLVVFGVVSSFISIFYYFRPVIAAYTHKGHSENVNVPGGVLMLLIILSLLTLLLGILPGWIAGLI